VSKPYDLFANQPKGPTALWNRFGVGRYIVYLYSNALYRGSLSLSVASRFDQDTSNELDQVLTVLKQQNNKQLLQRALSKDLETRHRAIETLQGNLSCNRDLICSALSIIEIREIKARRFGKLSAGYASSIAQVLKLPVRYGNEPMPSGELYNGSIQASITLGPGHFYTRRYLDTPGFQHLCSFYSLSEVLAAMKSTRLDDLINSIDDTDVKAKLEAAKKKGCQDLLSAHLYFLQEERKASSNKMSLREAAEKEVIHILDEINKSFDLEIGKESNIIEAEKLCVAGIASGFTLLAISAVGIAVFASPDLLTTIGLSSIQGLEPTAFISMFAAAAVLCAAIAITASIAASNNPGNEAKCWARSESILFDAKVPERSLSKESVGSSL